MGKSMKRICISKLKNDRKMKRVSNKKVRNAVEIGNGSKYKKVMDTCDICDYKDMLSLNKILDGENTYSRMWKEGRYEEVIDLYEREYKRK